MDTLVYSLHLLLLLLLLLLPVFPKVYGSSDISMKTCPCMTRIPYRNVFKLILEDGNGCIVSRCSLDSEGHLQPISLYGFVSSGDPFLPLQPYGRTYNRPVERSGDGKPSVGSNSQSVSINENVFQSFNSYAKAGNKSVDMSGKYGTCNAGAESVGVSDCNKVYKKAGNKAVMSISVDDCIDLDGMERSILAKVKDLSVISELLKHMSSEGFDDVGLRYVGGRWVWLEFDSMDQVESVKTSKALKEIFL
ncbi:hypothetical protein Tco_0515498 [Tanacetum coccineum]